MMVEEPIRGFAFLAAHHDALDGWADYMASMGWRGEVAEFDEAVPEALFVMPEGGDEPAFAVWRSLSSRFVVADWRSADTMRAGEMAYGTLDDALRAVETCIEAYPGLIAASGRSVSMRPTGCAGWGVEVGTAIDGHREPLSGV